MPSLIAYRKNITRETTTTLQLPLDDSGMPTGQELATLPDGRTVVVLPEGAVLPAQQPDDVAASIEHLSPLTTAMRAAIKAASPHCRLIDQRVIEKIRAMYTLDDEMYLARIGVGAANGLYQPSSDEFQAMTVFGEFVESVRQWGRAERAKLGL